MIFVALTNSIAGFESVAPDAKLDDGNFTLIIVKTAKLFNMLSLMIQAINGGKHVHDENVEYLKTKKLTIEMLGKNAQPFRINLDGEYGEIRRLNWKSSIITWNSLQILMKSTTMLWFTHLKNKNK